MNILGFQVQRISNRVLLDSMRDRKDMLAMQALAPLSSSYLPWSQAAMRPSGLVAVLNDIVINNRTSVVECGGGVSTFYIARLLKSRGGHIFSIENDETWANLLQKSLDDEGLHEQATVVYAPLAKTQYSWDGAQWYDEKKLSPILSGPKVDLLLVDGPPGYSKELSHARYPALPFFKGHLASDYTVVLDDINRQGEQEILERWGKELGIKFQSRFVDGTIGVGRPRRSFSV